MRAPQQQHATRCSAGALEVVSNLEGGDVAGQAAGQRRVLHVLPVRRRRHELRLRRAQPRERFLHPVVDPLPGGHALVRQQEARLVHGVDEAVLGDCVRHARQRGAGGEQVHQVEQAIRLTAARDHARPVGDAGHAHAALPGGPLRAAEGRAARVRPRLHVGAVVAADEHEGVVGLARALQRVHQPSENLVHLHDALHVSQADRASNFCAAACGGRTDSQHARLCTGRQLGLRQSSSLGSCQSGSRAWRGTAAMAWRPCRWHQQPAPSW